MTVRFFRQYFHLPIVLLAVFETVLLVISPLVANRVESMPPDELTAAILQCLLFASCCGVGLTAMGLYSARQRARLVGILLRAGVAILIGVLLFVSLSFFLPDIRPERDQIVLWAVLALAFVTCTRSALELLPNEDLFKRRVLVFGAGTRAKGLSQLRRRSDQRGFAIVGFYPADGEEIVVPADRLIRTQMPLIELVRRDDIDEIIVAMDDRRRAFPIHDLLECRMGGVEVVDIVSFLERETGKVRLDVLNPSWMIFGDGFRRDPLRQMTKRVFDIVAALALLAIAWPFMLVTAFAIMLEDGFGADILYRQRRVGLEGEKFDVLKFRSMRQDAERDGKAQWAAASDARVTRVGAFIRKVRIDELPQILNVLKGDMSFVGPRPERPEFVEVLGDSIPYYTERHYAKPGITGWAQICYPYGSSERDATEKLQYDLFYVKNQSLLFDLMILLQTVETVLLGKGGR